jgi:hypothetical protein
VTASFGDAREISQRVDVGDAIMKAEEKGCAMPAAEVSPLKGLRTEV